MKVKTKLMAVLASLKDQVMITRATITSPSILSDIETAILRSTSGHHDTSLDDKYVHEIHFLVSNSPGSITFLARRISRRLETARCPMVALKTLVLLHRLIRGGDRYFEQDLRNLSSWGELRLELSGLDDSLCSFVVKYSMFLGERLRWRINQAGKLEPTTKSCSGFESYKEELVLYRLTKCQTFLDLVMDCLPQRNLGSSHVGQLAMNIMLRESFRVYESFCEGMEILESSFVDLKKPASVLALDILRKACTQTPSIHHFFEECNRSIVGKSLDYPLIQIVTSAHVSSMEQLSMLDLGDPKLVGRNTKEENACQEPKEKSCESSMATFSLGLETKINMVWVKFEEENYQASSFPIGEIDDPFVRFFDDVLNEGESSTTGRVMEGS